MSVNGNTHLPGVVAFLVKGDGDILHVENLLNEEIGGHAWQLPESILPLFPSIFIHSMNDALARSQMGLTTHLRDMPIKLGNRAKLVDVHIWSADSFTKGGDTRFWVVIVDKRRHQDAHVRAFVQFVQRDVEAHPQQDAAHCALVDTAGHTILLSAGANTSFLAPWVTARQSVALDHEFELAGTGPWRARSLPQAMREACELHPCPVLPIHRRRVPGEAWTLQCAPVSLRGEVCSYACRLIPLHPQAQPIHGHVELHHLLIALEQGWHRLGHDIREPLDVILGYVNLLLLSPDPRVQPALIREAVDLASQRIRLALDESLTWGPLQAPALGWLPPPSVEKDDQT